MSKESNFDRPRLDGVFIGKLVMGFKCPFGLILWFKILFSRIDFLGCSQSLNFLEEVSERLAIELMGTLLVTLDE